MIRGIWCWSSTPPSRHQTEWDQWRHKGQRKGPTVQTPQTFSLSPGPKRKERCVPRNCTLHPKEEGKGETHRGRSAGSRRRTQHTVTQPRTQTLREPLQPCPGPPAAAREAQSAASLSRVLVWQMGVQWGAAPGHLEYHLLGGVRGPPSSLMERGWRECLAMALEFPANSSLGKQPCALLNVCQGTFLEGVRGPVSHTEDGAGTPVQPGDSWRGSRMPPHPQHRRPCRFGVRNGKWVGGEACFPASAQISPEGPGLRNPCLCGFFGKVQWMRHI